MKNCSKCQRPTDEKFDFCPFCGNPLDNSNNWGMLGKNDAIANNPFQSPLFNNSMINRMLGSAMKMLEKEMQKEMQNREKVPKTNLQLYINGKKVNLTPENIRPVKKSTKPVKRKVYPELTTFSKEYQKRFTKLPKEEPKTNVRRLADKIIFEVEMPGVKSIKEISIKNLENSIEIKAITQEKAYYKIIGVGLPIINYYLDQKKLILELEAKH